MESWNGKDMPQTGDIKGFPEFRIDTLPQQMTGIKIEAEGGVIIQCLQGPFRGKNIVGNFSRMYFKREPNIIFLEFVQILFLVLLIKILINQVSLCRVVIYQLWMSL